LESPLRGSHCSPGHPRHTPLAHNPTHLQCSHPLMLQLQLIRQLRVKRARLRPLCTLARRLRRLLLQPGMGAGGRSSWINVALAATCGGRPLTAAALQASLQPAYHPAIHVHRQGRISFRLSPTHSTDPYELAVECMDPPPTHTTTHTHTLK
jgi:hypothetical protein